MIFDFDKQSLHESLDGVIAARGERNIPYSITGLPVMNHSGARLFQADRPGKAVQKEKGGMHRS